MPAALIGVQRTLADLAGRAKLDDARRRARYGSEGATPVLRRKETVLSAEDQSLSANWLRRWRMTVLDGSRVSPEQYAERVRRWATAVSSALGGN